MDDFTISAIWYIKFSKTQIYQIWKHDNHPFWLEPARMIDQKTDYIHDNPVGAGFVNEPHEWRLSSANPCSPIGVVSYFISLWYI